MQNDTLIQAQFTDKMRQAGLRITTARQQIFDILLSQSSPISIQDLVSLTTNAHFVSVYRTIDAMQKASIVKLVPLGFKNLFELSDSFMPHHHHATCENCSKSVEVKADRLEQIMRQLSLEAGISPTHHHFELFGVCDECTAKEAKQD